MNKHTTVNLSRYVSNPALFKQGNEFWALRSTHGRDALFANALLMWEEAGKYFRWCDNNPLIEVDFRGKDAIEVYIPKKRVYTIQGLCLYFDANTDFWNQFKHSQTAKRMDFSSVIRQIENTIYNQKFSGAVAGFFNANIIARDLGLADKQEIKHEATPQTAIDYSKLSQSALDEIANATFNPALEQPADGFNKPLPIDQHSVTPEPGDDLI